MNLYMYLEKGGIIMYILLALNIIGFSIIIYKFIQIFYYTKNSNLIVDDIKKDLIHHEISSDTKFMIMTFLKDTLSFKMQKLESGLNTVKIIASISPLLGLLGTALGVFNSFEAISSSGLGDSSVFAKGISIALITTLGGLVVAIPHYISYNYLIGLVDNLESYIDSKLVLIGSKALR